MQEVASILQRNAPTTMSAKKRHHRTGEKRPPRRTAGACSKCGKPVYREEALIVNNSVFCLDEACRPEILTRTQKAPEVPPAPESSKRSGRRLIIHSLFTVALFAVVGLAWILREMTKLRDENRILRGSRLVLLEQLKSTNRELRTLADTEAQPPVAPAATPPARQPATLRPPRRSYPPSTTISRHFINGPSDGKMVALTFDGGSIANISGAILDTLASRSVTATMFLTGEYIRKHSDMVRRIVAGGHECGNHTYSHPHLTSYAVDRTNSTLTDITAARLEEQLRRTENLFHTITGRHFAPLWRAPYGEYNRTLCRWASNAGYLHIGWRQGATWREGLDSNDWVPDSTTPGFHTPAEFFNKVVHLARLEPHGINGGIILMHLGTQRKNPALQTHTVLGALIDTLRNEGYRFVPVSELVAATGIDLDSLQQRNLVP
jgi:peptidoglycan/xylan/chitin deacetylase (PgdA/CDA1 family)